MKKFLMTLALIGLVSGTAMADTNQSSVSPKATRAQSDDTSLHLDLSAGFTSEHGNTDQVDGVYNYGATLFKNVTPKLKAYFYGGDQIENEKAVQSYVPQSTYGAFVYNTGLVYKVNTTATLTASYDQTLGHNYRATGPTVYHQINLESNFHVF